MTINSKNLGTEAENFKNPDFYPDIGKKFPTGFPKLDKIMNGGFSIGYHGICGMPSQGKTTLALQIAENMSMQNYSVLIFSTETPIDLMNAASISRNSYILNKKTALSSAKVIESTNSDVLSLDLNAAIDKSASNCANIIVYDCSSWEHTVEEIIEVATNFKKTHNNDFVVFVDYLQEFQASEGKNYNDRKSLIDHVVISLKMLSQNLRIPIILVCAINRENYSHRISMDALKDTGRLEYNLDTIIALERLSPISEKETIRRVNFSILKQRTGVANKQIEYNFRPEFNYFFEKSQPQKTNNSYNENEENPISCEMETILLDSLDDDIELFEI